MKKVQKLFDYLHQEARKKKISPPNKKKKQKQTTFKTKNNQPQRYSQYNIPTHITEYS